MSAAGIPADGVDPPVSVQAGITLIITGVVTIITGITMLRKIAADAKRRQQAQSQPTPVKH